MEIRRGENKEKYTIEVKYAKKGTILFEEFRSIFIDRYPAIIEDILQYITLFTIPHPKKIAHPKMKPIVEEAGIEKPKWEGPLPKKIISQQFKNKDMPEKIFDIFKKLAENPESPEEEIYISFMSLANKFVLSIPNI